MLTPAEIAAADTVMTPEDKMLLLIFLRKSPIYQQQILIAGDTASAKIDAASTIQIQMLNALIAIMSNLGTSLVEIRGDEDALWYNVKTDIEAILQEIFYVLYSTDPFLLGTGIIPSQGDYGSVASIGQRPCYTTSPCNCNCSPCTCRKPRHWLDNNCF